MEVQFYKIIKVDNTGNSVSAEDFANAQNIKDYIWDLINNCVDSEGDREYIFDSTLQTTKNHIHNIIQGIDSDNICMQLARKLLAVEHNTKEKIVHLGKDIPKGMLMISFTKMTETEYKVVISKADYTEFLEEFSGDP